MEFVCGSVKLQTLALSFFAAPSLLLAVDFAREVQPLLAERGLLGQALFAQRVGWPDQLVAPAAVVSPAEQPYFSLLLIRQGWPAVLP